MRNPWQPIPAVALLLLASCASSGPAQQPRESRLSEPQGRPASVAVGGGTVENDGLSVEHDKGTLEQRDVDGVLDSHLSNLVACYERAGAAQSFAAGEVALRFFVAGSGEVSNVLVTSSAVGNFDVEQCLIGEGRRLKFPSPREGRATDFEYSLKFRSSGEVTVIDWDADVVTADVAPLAPLLGPCGSLGPAPVRAVVYIQPGGAVASVGLACDSPTDAAAAACVVEQIRKWRLPDDRQQVVRTSFIVPTAADVPPPVAPRDSRGRHKRAPRRRG